MKNTLYLLLALALSLAGTACSDGDTKLPQGKDIAIADWDIKSIDCQWNDEKLEEVEFSVVNSQEELARFILCPAEKAEIAGIDFTKKSLILLRGHDMSGISKMTTKLVRYEDYTGAHDGKYVLEVSIVNNLTTEAPTWTVAVLTDKLTSANDVISKVVRKDK